MILNILIRSFLFPLIFPLLSFQHSVDFSVKLKLITVGRQEIWLQVEVKNLSNTSAMILKNRTRDYKSNTRTFSGNYIIEIERRFGKQYQLYEAKPNPIPTHDTPEYIVLQKYETLNDMISLYGYHFSEEQSQQFSPGWYRVRASFNINGGSAQSNNSDWIEFVIQ